MKEIKELIDALPWHDEKKMVALMPQHQVGEDLKKCAVQLTRSVKCIGAIVKVKENSTFIYKGATLKILGVNMIFPDLTPEGDEDIDRDGWVEYDVDLEYTKFEERYGKRTSLPEHELIFRNPSKAWYEPSLRTHRNNNRPNIANQNPSTRPI